MSIKTFADYGFTDPRQSAGVSSQQGTLSTVYGGGSWHKPDAAMPFGTTLTPLDPGWVDTSDPNCTRSCMLGPDGILRCFLAHATGAPILTFASPSPLPANMKPWCAIFGDLAGYDGNQHDDGGCRINASILLACMDSNGQPWVYWASDNTAGIVPGTFWFASLSYFYLDGNGFPCLYLSSNDGGQPTYNRPVTPNPLY